MSPTTDPGDSLDRALQRALAAPVLPADFRQRLHAALARLPADELAERRRVLQREREEQLAGLRRDSVQLRLGTLGALIGGTFVAGVSTTLAWPWINATFAPHGALALSILGTAVGLTIALSSWLQRNRAG